MGWFCRSLNFFLKSKMKNTLQMTKVYNNNNNNNNNAIQAHAVFKLLFAISNSDSWFLDNENWSELWEFVTNSTVCSARTHMINGLNFETQCYVMILSKKDLQTGTIWNNYCCIIIPSCSIIKQFHTKVEINTTVVDFFMICVKHTIENSRLRCRICTSRPVKTIRSVDFIFLFHPVGRCYI